MRNSLSSLVVMVGLVACTRATDAGQSQAASPDARATPSTMPSSAAAPSPLASGALPAQTEANPAPTDSGSPSGRLAGGKCEYDDTPGVATVTTIEDEPANGDCRNHPKRVTLKFVADDAAAKPSPNDGGFRLGVGGVEFVAAGCLAAYKVSVGAKLKTVRHIIKAGTCSPRVYEVTSLSSPDDIEKCVGFCNK